MTRPALLPVNICGRMLRYTKLRSVCAKMGLMCCVLEQHVHTLTMDPLSLGICTVILQLGYVCLVFWVFLRSINISTNMGFALL